MSKYKGIYWASEDDYRKARFHLQGECMKIMIPFDELGHQIFISGAIEQFLKAADDYALVLRGVDKQIRSGARAEL